MTSRTEMTSDFPSLKSLPSLERVAWVGATTGRTVPFGKGGAA